MEKSNASFNIEQMALIVKKTPTEIKFALSLPLDKECHAQTRIEIRKMLLTLDIDSDPEGTMAAFKRWVEIFLKDVKNASSLGQAIDLLENCPKCRDAEEAILKKIAEFCGVTPENHFRSKVANLKTAEEIIACAFRFMPPKSKFISPSGKIQLERSSAPTNHMDAAELEIKEIGNKNKLLLRIYWSSEEKCPRMDRVVSDDWAKKW